MASLQYDELSDEVLAEQVGQGDRDAFGVLMRRYEEKMMRYGRRFLSRNDDLIDAVQDVFLRVYTNINAFNTHYRFSPWIYRIAHNVFVNVLRKQSKQSFAFIDFDTLIAPLSYDEVSLSEEELGVLRTSLETGLAKIAPKYREVLVLHYFEGLSYEEIADVLRIPKGTVGVRLRRGREALKVSESSLHDHYYGN